MACVDDCSSALTQLLLLCHTVTAATAVTTGIFGSLFHKGEQAVDDAKHTAQDTLSAAERKANEAKRAGKNAADDASKKASDAADEGKGTTLYTNTISTCDIRT
jgi:enoyl-CoA hydratase/carnithine racemase